MIPPTKNFLVIGVVGVCVIIFVSVLELMVWEREDDVTELNLRTIVGK